MANRIKLITNFAIAIVVAANTFSFDQGWNKKLEKLVESGNISLTASNSNEKGPTLYEQIFLSSRDTIISLLDKIEKTKFKNSFSAQLNSFVKEVKTGTRPTVEDRAALKNKLDSFNLLFRSENSKSVNECTQKGCSLFAEIIKSTQMMYLYVDGELRDSFKVSTGMNGYETPEMDLRPRGPTRAKFSSTKYPGGNYKGLGNMPYVVFLKGPYAIHGTTQGNFSKLGRKASHGCIRLHPDNALVFFELVNLIGLENTWVSVRETPVEDSL